MFLTRLLRLDATANVAGGAALAAASVLLAPALGLDNPWPLVAVGVALVVNGELNLKVAAHPSRRGVASLIAIDLIFAAAALELAVTDPFGADSWARWFLVAVADLSAIVGLAKWYGKRLSLGQSAFHSADDALGVQL
jgi:hypothetical protein